MTHLEIRRQQGTWTLLLDGQDITRRCRGFTLENDPVDPALPPRLTLHYAPDDLDINTDEVEVVEVPHEHRWIEVTAIEQAEKQEWHYLCDGCPAKRTVREVIESGDAS